MTTAAIANVLLPSGSVYYNPPQPIPGAVQIIDPVVFDPTLLPPAPPRQADKMEEVIKEMRRITAEKMIEERSKFWHDFEDFEAIIDRVDQLAWELVLAAQDDRGVWHPPLIGEIARRRAATEAALIVQMLRR